MPSSGTATPGWYELAAAEYETTLPFLAPAPYLVSTRDRLKALKAALAALGIVPISPASIDAENLHPALLVKSSRTDKLRAVWATHDGAATVLLVSGWEPEEPLLYARPLTRAADVVAARLEGPDYTRLVGEPELPDYRSIVDGFLEAGVPGDLGEKKTFTVHGMRALIAALMLNSEARQPR
ncbi:hypothetical protein [Kitasatospora viridis]|uniref:Uncharacterized protein n=1 Tax=Kitasatospora viridis TaxID=281105 RepID=A0A561SA64_9ACTN|nr:hypothetical protein [Kitasatospora viridis]TWF71695.1 hypothetical protein FHX73_1866 [Kitasatospora viridis]